MKAVKSQFIVHVPIASSMLCTQGGRATHLVSAGGMEEREFWNICPQYDGSLLQDALAARIAGHHPGRTTALC